MFTLTQKNKLDLMINVFFLSGLLFSSSVAYVGLTTEVKNLRSRSSLRIVGGAGLVVSAFIATIYGIIIKNVISKKT